MADRHGVPWWITAVHYLTGDKPVPVNALVCPHCGAVFGKGDAE